MKLFVAELSVTWILPVLSLSSCAADGFVPPCWAWSMAGMLSACVQAKCHVNSDAFVLNLNISHLRPHTELQIDSGIYNVSNEWFQIQSLLVSTGENLTFLKPAETEMRRVQQLKSKDYLHLQRCWQEKSGSLLLSIYSCRYMAQRFRRNA